MPLKDLGSRKETLSVNSSPYYSTCHGHLEDPLSCQELPNDKRKSDEKKGNHGADCLKARISPGISGYKRGFCTSQRTPDHINLFKYKVRSQCLGLKLSRMCLDKGKKIDKSHL